MGLCPHCGESEWTLFTVNGLWVVTCANGHEKMPEPDAMYRIGGDDR